MDDFYFAYGYSEVDKKALRLYRHINHDFERYNKDTQKWEPSPEQSCIFIGEDWDYDEISEEQALAIIEKWNN